MNVLSLFDGMSCGRIALNQLGIKVDTYYACEIDKFAMQVSNKNYPDIIQLGDVTKVKGVDLKNIDLLIGGSPCQGFSFAGKQLAFDDPRSALFFEFIRLKEECKPKYFLLENVRMKREHEDIISEYTGFEPIMINSSKLSAQNRVRLYWTNIPNVTQPKDTGVVLKDILQNTNDWGEQPRYLKNKWNGVARGNLVSEVNEKGSCLTASMFKGQVPLYVKQEIANDEYLKHMTTDEGKAYCLTASYNAAEPNNSLERKQRTMIPKSETCTSGHREPKVACGRMIGRHKIDGVRQDHLGSIAGKSEQMLELRKDEKTNTLSTVSKDNVVVTTEPNQINPSKKANGVQPYMQDRVFHVDGKSHALTTEFASRTNIGEIIDVDKKNKKLIIKEATKQGYTVIDDGDCFDLTFPESKTRRGRNMKDKSNCLTAANFDFMRYEHSEKEQEVYWRKLTPVECERLQTVPDNYTEGVSNSQRYRMLGNGWTVEVIKHIFKNIITDDKPLKPNFKKQQSLF